MINRRHIRIKVLQALYAAHQSGNTDIHLGKKALIQRLEKVYDLTVWQMSFLLALRDFAALRIAEAKHKHLPTEEDLEANTRFVDNALLTQWEENKDYISRAEKLKISWHTETAMIRKLYLQLVQQDFYQNYMQNSSGNYKDDKNFVLELFETLVLPHENLHALFAEKDFNWADDFNLAAELMMMIIIEFKKSWDDYKPLPTLFKDEKPDQPTGQDRAFATELFALCLKHTDSYDQMIKPKINNWEMDRVATIDRILIHMSLTEILYMPTIPLKVSLNEYIELSKYFSTPKSKIFINGLLDQIIKDLKAENKIQKQGRGLVE